MKKTLRIVGIAIPVAFLLLCLFGYRFAPNDPDHVDMAMRFAPSSTQFPLGTDNLGRCTLSRLLHGGRTTLSIVIAGCAIVVVLGTLLGLWLGSGKKGGHIFLEGLLNAVTAIPPIAYLIIFIAAWGNGVTTMLTAVCISLFLRLLKLVKTRAAVEMGKAYVMCAVASGSGRANLMFVQVLPNLLWDVAHFVLLSCADMVLSIVGFSFIGLGMGDNIIDWGTMVSETHHYIIAHPALTLYPVAFIFLCALAFNLLGRQIEKRGAVSC